MTFFQCKLLLCGRWPSHNGSLQVYSQRSQNTSQKVQIQMLASCSLLHKTIQEEAGERDGVGQSAGVVGKDGPPHRIPAWCIVHILSLSPISFPTDAVLAWTGAEIRKQEFSRWVVPGANMLPVWERPANLVSSDRFYQHFSRRCMWGWNGNGMGVDDSCHI